MPFATSICLIAVTAHQRTRSRRLRAERNDPARNGEARVRGESVYVALRAFLAKARVHGPLIRVAGTWDNTAAIVLQLDKRRQPIAVSDDAIWLIRPKKTRDGTEDADMTLADRSERAATRRSATATAC